MLAVVAAAVVIFLLSLTYKTISGYSSSNECILDNMKGVSSNNAAAMIRSACREMYDGVKASPAQSSPRRTQDNQFDAEYWKDLNRRINTPTNSSHSGDKSDVQSAIDNIPELRYWMDHDKERADYAASIDDELLNSAEWKDRPISERFREVVRRVKNKYGE